jgi:hypothetical protein
MSTQLHDDQSARDLLRVGRRDRTWYIQGGRSIDSPLPCTHNRRYSCLSRRQRYEGYLQSRNVHSEGCGSRPGSATAYARGQEMATRVMKAKKRILDGAWYEFGVGNVSHADPTGRPALPSLTCINYPLSRTQYRVSGRACYSMP